MLFQVLAVLKYDDSLKLTTIEDPVQLLIRSQVCQIRIKRHSTLHRGNQSISKYSTNNLMFYAA